MQTWWTRLEGISKAQRARVAQRLDAMDRGHRDLMAIYLSAHPTHHRKQRAHLVRITCLARGKAIVVEGERDSLCHALDAAVDELECEVLRLREHRHDLRRGDALAS